MLFDEVEYMISTGYYAPDLCYDYDDDDGDDDDVEKAFRSQLRKTSRKNRVYRSPEMV